MSTKKVLLTSVCRPFGEEYGDATSVGYELLHKQVTRAQGIFSPRAVHIHFGLDYIAANLEAPTVVLQYPSKDELIRELKKGYDYVGITFLMAVFHKMKETVALIREHAPQTKIVLGGYGTVLEDDMLRPYSDYICREEGVGFFRRLLEEPPLAMPYKHPLLTSDLSLFSVRVSRTGKIFAGLGCPNGCDFCCTSHFFKRRHVKLLPEGKDIHAVIERYQAVDPEMVFLIFDEDFLLNKKRALEFRDCVKASGKLPSIFVFSSVKAISQYTVEEILEMGIDGFWVGYEGKKSGYAKQQGRPVEEIFREFREHGITVLASMIVGFDYQDHAVVAEELAGLMELKPSLSQFLIYGPVPSTPFYNRIMAENRMQPRYHGQPEKFYRRADGFTTMIQHPTLSPEQIEGIQRWCFEQDFQRLGPSVLRVVESWLLGYRKMKDSPNPTLRLKAAGYKDEVRKAYPIFWAGMLFGPNAAIRRWVGELARQSYAEFGRPTVQERLMSAVVVGLAVWTKIKLTLNIFQHPKLTRTAYRMPETGHFHVWEQIARKFPEFNVRVEKMPATASVWVKIEGNVPAQHVETLGHRIREALVQTRHKLVLDLQHFHHGDGEALRSIREKLVDYKSRIRLILPRVTSAHPELLVMAALFKSYKG